MDLTELSSRYHRMFEDLAKSCIIRERVLTGLLNASTVQDNCRDVAYQVQTFLRLNKAMQRSIKGRLFFKGELREIAKKDPDIQAIIPTLQEFLQSITPHLKKLHRLLNIQGKKREIAEITKVEQEIKSVTETLSKILNDPQFFNPFTTLSHTRQSHSTEWRSFASDQSGMWVLVKMAASISMVAMVAHNDEWYWAASRRNFLTKAAQISIGTLAGSQISDILAPAVKKGAQYLGAHAYDVLADILQVEAEKLPFRSTDGLAIFISAFNAPKDAYLRFFSRYKKLYINRVQLAFGFKAKVISFNPTKESIRKVLQDDSIQHIVIFGHGEYGTVFINSQESISNVDFIAPLNDDEEGVKDVRKLSFYKKKGYFIKHSCGTPPEAVKPLSAHIADLEKTYAAYIRAPKMNLTIGELQKYLQQKESTFGKNTRLTDDQFETLLDEFGERFDNDPRSKEVINWHEQYFELREDLQKSLLGSYSFPSHHIHFYTKTITAQEFIKYPFAGIDLPDAFAGKIPIIDVVIKALPMHAVFYK